jgi:hypothetical protein
MDQILPLRKRTPKRREKPLKQRSKGALRSAQLGFKWKLCTDTKNESLLTMSTSSSEQFGGRR